MIDRETQISLESYGELLLDGVNPLGAGLRNLMMGRVSVRGQHCFGSFDDLVGEMYDLFERSPEARLRAGISRRANVPYSEVHDRWSQEDLAADVAWSTIVATDKLKRCSNCGVSPDEVMDLESRRPLSGGRWKVERVECWPCATRSAQERQMSKEDRERGVYWRMAPRADGDPWVDDSGGMS